MAREYDPNFDDEREVPLLEDDEMPAPPPTIDPDEAIEVDDREDLAVEDLDDE
jgi:hypothetical protein